MTCSPLQLAANRANAQKSTGPRTLDGKDRSRRNSYKHGLTGAGIALPEEDVAEVQERFDDFQAELRPNSVLARVLTQRAALFSVRLERCARQETVALSEKIRSAESDFNEARATEVDRIFGFLVSEPAACLRRLKRMPEGLLRLISAWHDLRHDLTREAGGFWSSFHQERAENLTGRHCRPHRVSRIRALSAGIDGQVHLLDDADLAHRDLKRHCVDELARLIDSEIEQLKAELAALDLDALDQDRAEAADRALFDPSPQATLARRYEAAAERGLYKALDRIEATRDTVIAPPPTPIEPEMVETPPPFDPADLATPQGQPSLLNEVTGSFFPADPIVELPTYPLPEQLRPTPKFRKVVTYEIPGARKAQAQPDPVEGEDDDD